ncbi:TonB-dependent receptor plug domain-containing protein [Parasulfitobacter algicola]|uniref:TonB-dependent receptor plug domain-containing protein n=1 Tax=Parasulfitobacter algicola TaxID=2614809 RepID=UPI0031B64B21
MVFSANQTETEANRTGATVEVVTSEDLAETQTTRVADYLTRLPGISVTTNGSIGNSTQLRVRGLDGKYVAVRIDGIDVTDPASPQTSFNFGSLTTDDIARIEVLKGSQSALYGSEAIGGVINITTNRATEIGSVGSFAAEVGSHDTLRTSANFSNRTETSELSFSISHIQTDGFSSADENDGNDEADGHTSTRLSISAAFDTSETVRLGFSAFYQDSESDFDEFIRDGTPDEETLATTFGLRAFAEIAGADVDHTVSASIFENDRESISNGDADPFKGNRSEITYQGDYIASDRMRYSFGADYTKEEFRSTEDDFSAFPVVTTLKASGETEVFGLFGETLYSPNDQIDLALSLRVDDHSEFGTFASARAALAYRPSNDWIIRTSIGNGFRAPSLYELNSNLYGNKDLDPEESMTFELGAERQFSETGFVKATLFYMEIEDLIQFDNGYKQVPGTTTSQGFELSTNIPVSDRVSLFGAYTYVDIQDSDDDRVIRVPEHDLILGLSGAITDRLSGIISAQYIDGVVDSDFPDTIDMPSYTVVNSTLSYDLTDATQAYLRVENMFDEEYQTIRGYGQSDRAFYVGLRTSF